MADLHSTIEQTRHRVGCMAIRQSEVLGEVRFEMMNHGFAMSRQKECAYD